MGVPAFFRWLSRKYPSVIVHCTEKKTVDVNGTNIPIDSSEPNPNGVEFDNLYLDMNGIIHPCTHPEDKPAPKNEDEMMIAIFESIDRLFRIVRPRKVLYMAIDGVAPRAKMNQQRSRRFRASKETHEKIIEMSRIRAELLLKGATLPPEKPKGEHFDSNCITPGTPFMARLSSCLNYYIHDRLNNDPGWKGIKVILSDANVPGEGEHKIMDFIRKQRAQPDHDPNTQHCLCGADADLIMLGLATHEANFTIIREEFKPNKPRPCDMCGQLGHEMVECVGLVQTQNESSIGFSAEGEFIFVRLNVLREYLERELEMPKLPFKYEFERAIDDWVFMCFFVGNDFLPHLPSLEIREGAIDRLVTLYKDTVFKTGGWITDSGDVNLERVQLIMSKLGEAEDEIFKTRQQKEIQFKERSKRQKRQSNSYHPQHRQSEQRPNWSIVKNTQFAPMPVGQSHSVSNPRQEAYNIRKAGMHTDARLQSIESKSALEAMIRPADGSNSGNQDRGVKRGHDEDDDQAHDEVRLWEDGFKDRYYESKFDITPDKLEFRNTVALHYVRGLCWVLRYYYQGCASWKWFYPYHYAPFASDFLNIGGLSTEFEEDTKPFRPLEQLMGVFPAASGNHVPLPWAKLMSDPESTIIDFYPEDFKIDLNGKKFAWQGVALLPFVDEKRLFKALEPYYQLLTSEEIARNIRGSDRLYLSIGNSGYDVIKGIYDKNEDDKTTLSISIDGMQGQISVAEECVLSGEVLHSPIDELPTIKHNIAYCVNYSDPKYQRGFVFPAVKLKGAVLPQRVLKPQDLDAEANRAWRPQIGMARSNQRGSLTDSGHRMVNHYSNRPFHGGGGGGGGGGGNYNNDFNRRGGGGGGGYSGGYNNSNRGSNRGGYNTGGFNQNYGNASRGGYNSGRNNYDRQQGGMGRGGFNQNSGGNRYNYRR